MERSSSSWCAAAFASTLLGIEQTRINTWMNRCVTVDFKTKITRDTAENSAVEIFLQFLEMEEKGILENNIFSVYNFILNPKTC